MESVLLSIVIAVRNDNYGGDFNTRLQNFIDWNSNLLEQHKVAAEIVLVNWNPIPDAPSLLETIKIPHNLKHVKLRMVTVGAETHRELSDPKTRFIVPLFEFIAKNVGIRRSTGEYILCTNADVLIHPEIIQFIAEGQLNKKCFYRAHRLDFAKTETLTVNSIYNNATVVSLVAFAYWFRKSILPNKLQYSLFKTYNSIRIWWEMFRYNNRAFFQKVAVSITYDNAAFYCHCNTSGDFMLMHREHWLQLKGYPESTFVSTHTDSLFTFMAYAHLKCEHVFSSPVFHQEHERRYGWKEIEGEEKFLNMFRYFQQEAKLMLKNDKATVYNSDNWGLLNNPVNETTIPKA